MNKSDLKRLLELHTENENLDYKQDLNWLNMDKFEKGELIKDVLAFSNSLNGGKIVLGVEDTKFTAQGVEENSFNSFDTTSFNDFLIKYTEPNHNCYIHKFEIDDKRFIVIDVPEFISTPIICKKNLTKEQKVILQEGAIYIRTKSAKSKKIQDANMMSDLLLRAIKHKSDELLSNIELLLSGKKQNEEQVNIFDEDLAIAKKVIEKNIGREITDNKYGNNLLRIYPSINLSNQFSDIDELKDRFNKSIVNNRGWDFPHIQNNNENGKTYNIKNGFTSYTIWSKVIESFCLFNNGLLVWQGVFWEELDDNDKGTLSFIKEIYDLIEYCIFIARFYDIPEVKPDINFELTLNNCYKKRLVSNHSSMFLFDNDSCEYPGEIKIKHKYNIVEYKTNSNNIVKNTASQIFNYFNLKIDEKIIFDWIDKYESRKY